MSPKPCTLCGAETATHHVTGVPGPVCPPCRDGQMLRMATTPAQSPNVHHSFGGRHGKWIEDGLALAAEREAAIPGSEIDTPPAPPRLVHSDISVWSRDKAGQLHLLTFDSTLGGPMRAIIIDIADDNE